MKKLPVTIKQGPEQTSPSVQNTWPRQQKPDKQLHPGWRQSIDGDQLDFPGAHRERLSAMPPMPKVVTGNYGDKVRKQDSPRSRHVKILPDEHMGNDEQRDDNAQRQHGVIGSGGEATTDAGQLTAAHLLAAVLDSAGVTGATAVAGAVAGRVNGLGA